MSLLKEADVINTTTYEFAPSALEALIAKDLGVPVNKISVHYDINEVGADPMDRYPGTNTVTKIRVTVKS